MWRPHKTDLSCPGFWTSLPAEGHFNFSSAFYRQVLLPSSGWHRQAASSELEGCSPGFWARGERWGQTQVSAPRFLYSGGKQELFKGTLSRVIQRSHLFLYPVHARVLQYQTVRASTDWSSVFPCDGEFPSEVSRDLNQAWHFKSQQVLQWSWQG